MESYLDLLFERLKTSRLLQVVLLLLLLAPLQYHFAAKLWRYQAPGYGDSAPVATVFTEAGGEWTPASDSGRIVVLSFWASWCEPCRRELPLLDSLYGNLDSTDAVRFYAVNVGESRATVADHVRRTGLKLPVLYDSTEVASRVFAVTALPTLVVIDDDGKILLTESGLDSRMTSVLRSVISQEVEGAFRQEDENSTELLEEASKGAESVVADTFSLEFSR